MVQQLSASRTVEEPIDLVRLSLDENVFVKCRAGRELRGKLQAYDNHLNLVLSDVEERITSVALDEETGEEIVKVTNRNLELTFVRGDGVILLSPPLKA